MKKATSIDQNALLFFLIYFLYGFKVILSSVQLSDIYLEPLKLFFNIASILISGFAFLSFTFKQKIVIFIISFLMMTNFLLYQNYNLYDFLILTVLIFIIEKCSYDTTIKIIFYSNLLIFMFVVPFLFWSERFYINDIKSGIRFTYGFIHPNVTAQYITSIFFILCAYSFHQIKKIGLRFISLIAIYLPAVWLILQTQSRTSIVIISVSVILMFLYIKQIEIKRVTIFKRYSISLMVLTIFLFQLLSSIFFRDYSFLYFIDYMLSGRIYQGNQLFVTYGFPPLFHGLNIQEFMPIDFYFIGSLYSVGFIFTLLTIIYVLTKVLKAKVDGVMFVIIIMNLLTTLTEFHFQIPIYSTALFMLLSKK